MTTRLPTPNTDDLCNFTPIISDWAGAFVWVILLEEVVVGRFSLLLLLLLLLLVVIYSTLLFLLWRPSRSLVAVQSVCGSIYIACAYTYPSHDHDRPPRVDHILLLYHTPLDVRIYRSGACTSIY